MKAHKGFQGTAVAVIMLSACAAIAAPKAVGGDDAGAAKVAWENDFSSTDGWQDASVDPGMNAYIRKESGKGTCMVTQDGDDTWGKVAFLVEDVNLEETPILEAVLTQVGKGSAFKIGVSPLDWSEFIEVLKRSSADGTHKGDIEKAVKRAGRKDLLEGPASFYVVIVVEGKGKSAYFDHLRITAEK